MKKTAFIFPGQGSQFVGMGFDLYQEYDFIRELFDMAEEISRINLSKLCFKGPVSDLTMTVNLQPAITVVNLACLAAISKENIAPDITAGHSLGEYSALCAADIISQEDTIKLVAQRGKLMDRESTRFKGIMHAVVGLPIDMIQAIVSQVQGEGIVAIANHNAENQIVTTGAPDPVKKVSAIAKEKGAKVIPLKVSGAWHSELIKGAEDEFNEFLNTVFFNKQKSSIVLNVTADFAKNQDEVKTIMSKQLCSPVRWYDSNCKLIKEKVEIFVEIGPGKVLAGLLKKTLPKQYPYKIFNVNSVKTIESFLNAVA